jgi:hypothetical protein
MYPKGSSPGTGYYQVLDAAKLAELQSADLIIMSRDVNSGGYASDDAERNQWCSITKPLILMSQHHARSGNARWFNTQDVDARVAYYSLRAVNRQRPPRRQQ